MHAFPEPRPTSVHPLPPTQTGTNVPSGTTTSLAGSLPAYILAEQMLAGSGPENNQSLLLELGSSAAWSYLSELTLSLWKSDRTLALDVLAGALRARAGWLTPRFIGRLNKLAKKAAQKNTRDLFHFLAGVQARLDKWRDDGTPTYALRWIEINRAVAKAAHDAGLSAAAMQSLQTAWDFRLAIPDSRRLFVMCEVASDTVSVLGRFGKADYEDHYLSAVNMLSESVDIATSHARKGTETCLINLFEAYSRLSLSQVRFGLASSLEASASVIAHFEEAVDHLERHRIGSLGDFAAKIRHVAATARGTQRAALFKVLLTACDSASILGDRAVEGACLDAALSCAGTDGERLRLLVWQAKKTDDIVLKTRLCEELLQGIESDNFARHAPVFQISVLGLAVDTFSQLNSLLRRQGMFMLASFWRTERNAAKKRIKRIRSFQHGAHREPTRPWEPEEFPDLDLLDNSNRSIKAQPSMVQMPVATQLFADEMALAEAWSVSLTKATRLENTSLVVDCLVAISDLNVDETAWESMQTALATVNAWWPQKRSEFPEVRSETLESPKYGPSACLLIALSLVAEYVPYRRTSVLSRLARIQHLPSKDRMIYALEAAELAMNDHAWIDAANALAAATILAVETGDRAIVKELVGNVCEIVDQISVVSGPVAGVVEGLMTFKAHLAEVYCALGEAEFDEEAFKVGLKMIGQVELNLLAYPERIAEFELFERHHRDLESPSDYFAAIRARILANEPSATNAGPSPRRGPPRVSVPRHSMILQLQPGADLDSPTWVMVGINDGEQTAYSSYKAPPQSQLRSWIRSVWHSLDHDDSVLPSYYAAFIKPIEARLTNIDRIIVMADASMPEIPLHAAKSSDGYLIEKFCITYCSPNHLRSNRIRNIERTAYVGGWHPEVNGAGESAAIYEKMTSSNIDATRLASAKEGKREILTRGSRVGIVHLVAHGEPQPWPNGSRSKLELAPSVSITAGEWMAKGCSAAFVFVNACYAGSAVRAPGHRSGFPLAFSLSGARASVTALHLVFPEPAEAFALRFYGHLAGRDTLSAYQASCRQSIQEGEPESTWVPYVHQGLPVALTPV